MGGIHRVKRVSRSGPRSAESVLRCGRGGVMELLLSNCGPTSASCRKEEGRRLVRALLPALILFVLLAGCAADDSKSAKSTRAQPATVSDNVFQVPLGIKPSYRFIWRADCTGKPTHLGR